MKDINDLTTLLSPGQGPNMINNMYNATMFTAKQKVGKETWIDKLKKGNKFGQDPKIRSHIAKTVAPSRQSILN